MAICHVQKRGPVWIWIPLELEAAEAGAHIEAHQDDNRGACPERPRRPPIDEPSPQEPSPAPSDRPDRLTICHVEDRSDTEDRHRIPMTLPRERAEWHLKAHGPRHEGGDGRGDVAGECKAREGPDLFDSQFEGGG